MGLITGIAKGTLKATGALLVGSAAVTGAVIVGTGAFVAGTVESMIDSNEPKVTPRYNNKLNPYKNIAIETELNKLPKKIKKALIKNKITIEIDDAAVRRQGPLVEGFYSYYDRKITLKSNEDSIRYALFHEIGHALDHIANISDERAVKKSYKRHEISFNSSYFYSTIEEYVAESIANYCNGILPKDTTMYRKLDVILDCISWDSINEE